MYPLHKKRPEKYVKKPKRIKNPKLEHRPIKNTDSSRSKIKDTNRISCLRLYARVYSKYFNIDVLDNITDYLCREDIINFATCSKHIYNSLKLLYTKKKLPKKKVMFAEYSEHLPICTLYYPCFICIKKLFTLQKVIKFAPGLMR